MNSVVIVQLYANLLQTFWIYISFCYGALYRLRGLSQWESLRGFTWLSLEFSGENGNIPENILHKVYRISKFLTIKTTSSLTAINVYKYKDLSQFHGLGILTPEHRELLQMTSCEYRTLIGRAWGTTLLANRNPGFIWRHLECRFQVDDICCNSKVLL